MWYAISEQPPWSNHQGEGCSSASTNDLHAAHSSSMRAIQRSTPFNQEKLTRHLDYTMTPPDLFYHIMSRRRIGHMLMQVALVVHCNMKIKLNPHSQPQNSVQRIFCLRPGLEREFLLIRIWSGQELLPLQFPELSHYLSQQNQVSLVRTFAFGARSRQ